MSEWKLSGPRPGTIILALGVRWWRCRSMVPGPSGWSRPWDWINFRFWNRHPPNYTTGRHTSLCSSTAANSSHLGSFMGESIAACARYFCRKWVIPFSCLQDCNVDETEHTDLESSTVALQCTVYTFYWNGYTAPSLSPVVWGVLSEDSTEMVLMQRLSEDSTVSSTSQEVLKHDVWYHRWGVQILNRVKIQSLVSRVCLGW